MKAAFDPMQLRTQSESGLFLQHPARSQPSAVSTAPSIAEAIGELRHVKVMFCDLVDSTGIAAKLDAEEWRDLDSGETAARHRARRPRCAGRTRGGESQSPSPSENPTDKRAA
jgi:hypothetical protein